MKDQGTGGDVSDGDGTWRRGCTIRAGGVLRAGALVVAISVVGAGFGAAAATGGGTRPSSPGTTTTGGAAPETTTPTTQPTRYITFAPGGGLAIGVTNLQTSAAPAGSQSSLRRVATRTVGGVHLRLYDGSFMFSLGILAGGLSASCLPNRQLLVDASTNDIVGALSFYTRTGQSAAPQGGVIGQTEGEPVAVVAAQVPPGTRAAAMRFSGGVTDRAAPIADNWVVLASRVPPLPSTPGATVTVTLGTLSVIDHAGHSQRLGSVPAAIGFPLPASCAAGFGGGGTSPAVVGPPLPAATGPPPADAARAQAAVESVFHRFFESPPGTQTGLLEDESALSDVIHELQSSSAAKQYAGKTKIRIDAFRFLDSTHAALRYDVLFNGQPLTTGMIGRAVLVHGQWKIALSTYCEVAAQAGVQC